MEEKNKKMAVIYQAENGAIQFYGDFEGETIWASQKQLAEVFEVDVRTVNEHIGNVLKSEELDENQVVRNFRITASDGKKYNTKHYNLDMMISVGYRVNSKKATEFRKWATKVLKQHLVEGYTVNNKQFEANKQKLLKAFEDLKKLASENVKVSKNDVLDLVKSFTGTWFTLESYDKDMFPSTGLNEVSLEVEASELYKAVEIFKYELIEKEEATDLFAQEKTEMSLRGILGNVFQSAFGEDVYGSIEEKAAHLLYFIIKNHPFNDGNKRTGAFSFIWFLQKANVDFRQKINPATLTTLALLIAESNPRDKDKMVGLVLLILK